MRMLIVCLVVAFVCAAVPCAAATEPAILPPDVEQSAINAPSPAEQIKLGDETSAPLLNIPSPILPSKPIGPVAQPTPVPDLGEGFIRVSADSLRTTTGEDGKPLLTTATGKVTARYRDMSITAGKGTVDYKTNIATFEDDVVFKLGIQEARGKRVEVNIRTWQWSIETANVEVTPEFVKGMIKAPVFAGSKELSGLRDREVSAFQSHVTTCNLAHPHYDILAQEMTVYPNDKIIFTNAQFVALGKKLVTLRRFVVPIRDVHKNPNLIPRVGQSSEEGIYLKMGYSALASKSNTTYLLADLMQRKGIGLGIQDTYKLKSGSGNVFFYALDDRNINQRTFTGKFNHTQQFGDIKMEAASDLRSNSYLYAPQSKSINNRLAFTRDKMQARSSLMLNQSINDLFQRTTTLTASARHRQGFGLKSYWDTSFDYTDYGSSAGSRARLVSQSLYSRREDKFDWEVSAQKITDLSDEAFVGKGQFGGIERLPEVSISSDTTRLGHVMPFGMPAQMKFSYGRFAQFPLAEIDRGYLDITTPTTHHKLSSTWSAASGAGFKQFVYGDNTAQYSVDANAQVSKKLGDSSTFALTYRYQMPRGFSPFRFDYIGKYNILNANLDLTDNSKFNMSLIGGYNFEQKMFPWQDSVVRISYTPTNSLLLYTATGYDFNRSQWRQVINQLRIRSKDDFKLDVGTRYDPIGKRLATVRSVLDMSIGNKNRLQALCGWNGITRDFDYKGLAITRDLHCWEAALTYIDQGGFYSDKGIYFTLRIKAFPMLDTFGVGNFGQALDTSVGQVY